MGGYDCMVFVNQSIAKYIVSLIWIDGTGSLYNSF